MARRSSGGLWSGLFALALGIAVIYFVVAWPYLLGSWLAVKMGAAQPSTPRTALGWTFELVYLGTLLAAGVLYLWRRSTSGRKAGPLSGRLVGGFAATIAAVLVFSTGATALAVDHNPTEQTLTAAAASASGGGAGAKLAADTPATSPAVPKSTPSPAPSSTPVTQPTKPAGTGTAVVALATLKIKGRAPMTGYSRDQFGPAWADVNHNGCDTRNDILTRDLTARTFKAGTHECIVLTGLLADPYTATTIHFTRGTKTSTAVQIDHAVALGDAWQTGAQQLSADKRAQLANDPLELLAVDGPSNESKGDGDAATWLPPNKAFRCQYVARQVAVKQKYDLWVTQAEHDAIARILGSCPGQVLPSAGAKVTVVVAAGDGASTDKKTDTHTSTTAKAAAPKPAPKPAPAPAPASVYYANCTAVHAAGAAPIYAGDPGYSRKLDRDGDGVACES